MSLEHLFLFGCEKYLLDLAVLLDHLLRRLEIY